MHLIHTRETDDGAEQDLVITFTGYYDEGKTYGPPETCYPSEGEVTFQTVSVDGGPAQDFDTWAKSAGLTSDELRKLEGKAFEVLADEDEDEYRADDYEDRDELYGWCE